MTLSKAGQSGGTSKLKMVKVSKLCIPPFLLGVGEGG